MSYTAAVYGERATGAGETLHGISRARALADLHGRARLLKRYTAQGMAGKVTLYVRDDDLWTRARRVSGPGGLSDLVQECLRQWLDRSAGSAPPTMLERARRIRQDADALVHTLEESDTAHAGRRTARRRRVVRSGR